MKQAFKSANKTSVLGRKKDRNVRNNRTAAVVFGNFKSVNKTVNAVKPVNSVKPIRQIQIRHVKAVNSVKKSLTGFHIAHKLHRRHQLHKDNRKLSSDLMWGVGFALPAGFQALSMASGMVDVNSLDWGALLVANLLLATVFRFTLGTAIVRNHIHHEHNSRKEAEELIRGGQANSDSAQYLLSQTLSMKQAMKLLMHGKLNSAPAQVDILRRYGSALTSSQLHLLLRSGKLSSGARNRVNEMLKLKRHSMFHALNLV